MSNPTTGWLGIPWWTYAALALALAIVWCYIWPADRLPAAPGALRFVLVRWGHAATWFLLAANFALRQWLPAQAALADGLALAGLAAYIGFLAALLLR